MRASLPLALTWLALWSCADAQDPSASGEPEAAVVVVDGRSSDGDPDVSGWASEPAVQAAVRSARAHWSAVDAAYEEEVRVLAVASGAFTAPGADQRAVLYLMSRWPRCCPKVGVAIVEASAAGPGGALLRNVAFESPTHDLRTVPDLDGDGLDELALVSGFGMGGSEERSVQLATVGEGPMAVRGHHALYSGSCGAMRDGEEAYQLSVSPGPEPALLAERYVRATCEGGSWAPAGEPVPVGWTSPDGSAFTELPVDGPPRG